MYIIFIISCLNPLGKEWVAAQKIINKLVDESIGKFLAIVVVMCVVQCCSVLLGLEQTDVTTDLGFSLTKFALISVYLL